ncbi:SagB/ThcOx family dehydrogenase [Natranaerofaba carboxydovora]|uniref:SagB/ThcOx family dehydrogenase n=1 Tax=Natranaerofaba carboxydovora TaxID=2742683 RepID=UPI001F12CC3F|nr:SagB/ThcOx family dehydrogenase [Natranaerofaba carboxydovora]UMZ72813.1 Nitroreductase family protein [Natranaerofaba carboxydovora]
MIKLPAPKVAGKKSLEEVINKRKSIRKYSDSFLSLNEVSQLLWASSMVPSAGAIYPMVIYLVAENISDLDPGIYRYSSSNHSLEKFIEGNKGASLAKACLGQSFVAKAPINIVVTAIYEKIKAGYGERGIRYAIIEAGHISQNVYLQAEALELGTVAIGAFYDDHVSEVLELSTKEKPLYVMPVGRT